MVTGNNSCVELACVLSESCGLKLGPCWRSCGKLLRQAAGLGLHAGPLLSLINVYQPWRGSFYPLQLEANTDHLLFVYLT